MAFSQIDSPGIWQICLFIILRTMNQVLFKQVALGPGGNDYIALLFDPLFYLSCIIFFAQALVWLQVLKRFALSFAYPFTSVLFITLMLAGAVFFDEAITLNNMIGSLFIMIGVIVATGDKQLN